MGNTEHLFLRFVRFKALDNWSVSHILGMNMGFTDMFPMIPIGQIIDRCTKLVTVENEIQYKQITLKTNGGGAVLRDVKLGKDIGTKKQYVVSSGQFIMSKIDARNGAFGVISDDLDGAIVTADFPVFNVNQEKIISQYLFLLSSTKAFARFAQSCSRGTTNRQRIDIALFLSQRIPLPSLTEQKIIFSNYNAKIQQAEDLEKKSIQIEKDIDTYLLESLGIFQNEEVKNKEKNLFKFLKFIQFKDVDRWDVSYYTHKKNTNGKYRVCTMNECVENFMQDENGVSLRIETSKLPKENFLYIGMEDIEKNSGVLIRERNIQGADVKSQTIRVPNQYFLYGKLRPYLNKYWVNETHLDNIVCSSEFFVFSIKPYINRDYFKYFLSSSVVQQQIFNAFQGARMPRINENTFKKIQIPIPPIDIQDAIVNHINEQKTQIKQLKQQAESLRKEALIDFEKEIFIS